MKMALLKYAGLVDHDCEDFAKYDSFEWDEHQEDILYQQAIYYLKIGGTLSANDMIWLTQAERVSLLAAQESIANENLLLFEQGRRLDDEDIAALKELPECEWLTEAEKMKRNCVAAAIARATHGRMANSATH